MALVNSRNAIGAVSRLLRRELQARTGETTTDVLPIENAAGGTTRYNLFLYQIDIDSHLRNIPLDEGQRAPIWLVLHYLLTAFDGNGESDTLDAHEMLGAGMLALHELNFQRPDEGLFGELSDNPEPLKITFDTADADLLSKVMQASQDDYRVSVAFQVRPVMIAPGELPSYAPLVHSVGPRPDEGVAIIPSLGPRLTEVVPTRFEVAPSLSPPTVLTLRGHDLTSAIQWVCLGDTCFPVTAAPEGALEVRIPPNADLSPAIYPVTVARELPNGRRIYSNPVLGELQPTLASATPTLPLSTDGNGNKYGTLTLTGDRVGGADDDIFVAFWSSGRVELMAEPISATGTSVTVTVAPADALPSGNYRIILRVNGSQAPATPEVNWS